MILKVALPRCLGPVCDTHLRERPVKVPGSTWTAISQILGASRRQNRPGQCSKHGPRSETLATPGCCACGEQTDTLRPHGRQLKS
jgi:hypothetical protein